jgi:hypothetical protein
VLTGSAEWRTNSHRSNKVSQKFLKHQFAALSDAVVLFSQKQENFSWEWIKLLDLGKNI